MDNILIKINSATGLSAEEIEKKIVDKQRELSGLVSREGAAYIVAKELGLDLIERKVNRIVIKDLNPEMRGIALDARVLRVFGVREFERAGQKSKVANILLGDTSGVVRMSLWDKQLELLEMLMPGTAIEIFGAYVREDNRGDNEIRLGKRGGVRVKEHSDLPMIENIAADTSPKAFTIGELTEGSNGALRAMVMQLFDTEQFYEICPTCGTRIRSEAGKYTCKEHGAVQPEQTIVVSGVIDDGTGNIRAVCFRDNAYKLLGMTKETVLAKKGHLFDSVDVLGKEFIFFGRARKNKMFERLEFIVNDIMQVDIKLEIEKAINVFGSNV